ncbi:MAG: hypothetical protein OHK0037_01230 [Elainellaceae cyanobacterium]
MAGLFGLFGKKNNAEAQPSGNNGAKPGAYFLDADDAKTMGNIEYMRSTKVIKHKFPKTAGNGGEFEMEYEVSSSDMKSGNGLSAPTEPTAAPSATPSKEANERRTTDSSMDLFRNMARDIRKR